MPKRDRALPLFVALVFALFLGFGFVADGPLAACLGFLRLQFSPARLLSDYTALAGIGAALVNAAMVGLLGFGLMKVNGIGISGATIAALMTMMGFALFGKTVLNSLPIMIGVCISALIVGKRPREYTLIAMFGTGLGPVVSFVAFELGLDPVLAYPAAAGIGMVVGIILPPLAIAMLHLHQGYSLFNVGFTMGFIGLFAASLSNAGGGDIRALYEWGKAVDPFLYLVVPLLGAAAIAFGFAFWGKTAWEQFVKINSLSGRLPSDFTDMVGAGGTLLNAGILALAYSGLVALLGAPFNGPVIGGLMTLLGFSFFGVTPKNAFPVLAGLLAAALLFGKPMTESWVILAFLFGTALSPIAGEFGLGIGFLAGFLHLVIVERSGTWHGGMNLYNNGFAAGLTATLIVSIVEWYRNSKDR
ncbi:MAG TPA: DUF1576 domain-containing protein [Rectinemataceae bacterium]